MKDEKSGRSLKLLELQELGMDQKAPGPAPVSLHWELFLPVGHPAAPRGVKRGVGPGICVL